MRGREIFACIMFVWVWLISMLDHYLTIKLSKTIIEEEKNPLGSMLLQMDHGSPALFMTVKMAGLWAIFFILILTYRWRPKAAIISLIILSLIQLLLVVFFIS